MFGKILHIAFSVVGGIALSLGFALFLVPPGSDLVAAGPVIAVVGSYCIAFLISRIRFTFRPKPPEGGCYELVYVGDSSWKIDRIKLKFRGDKYDFFQDFSVVEDRDAVYGSDLRHPDIGLTNKEMSMSTFYGTFAASELRAVEIFWKFIQKKIDEVEANKKEQLNIELNSVVATHPLPR